MATLRSIVRGCIRNRDYDRVLGLLGKERRLIRSVSSLLYDEDDLIRWRAVTMIGRIAEVEPGLVKPLIQRFIWSMNDESGGIGWSSAPALGEIGRRAPELLRDSVRVVVFWRHERILLKSVFWAAGRLEKTYPAVVREAVPDLVAYLGDRDGALRGQAAWSLGVIGDRRAREGLETIRHDRETVRLYDKEKLTDREVGDVAAEAVGKLDNRS